MALKIHQRLSQLDMHSHRAAAVQDSFAGSCFLRRRLKHSWICRCQSRSSRDKAWSCSPILNQVNCEAFHMTMFIVRAKGPTSSMQNCHVKACTTAVKTSQNYSAQGPSTFRTDVFEGTHAYGDATPWAPACASLQCLSHAVGGCVDLTKSQVAAV